MSLSLRLAFVIGITCLGVDARAATHGDAACVHCHEDPHRAQVGTACASCHGKETWKPSTFDAARHLATAFPLKGRHATLSCARCHSGGQFKGTSTTCDSCHFDLHDGKLGKDCASCHGLEGFTPVEHFDHARSGFVLAGPHAAASCASCHEGPRAEKISEGKAPFGCVTCHAPAHGAELGDDCATCHAIDSATATFKAARGLAFPEHARTGFALERRHAVQRCASCHPAAGPTPTARCAGCHVDPHGGRAGVECELCHEADRWRLVRFDHDRAGWPLRGRHFVTPCASCHTSQRWVGLSTECFDCHALDAGRAKGIVGQHPFGPLDCRECHQSLWKWK